MRRRGFSHPAVVGLAALGLALGGCGDDDADDGADDGTAAVADPPPAPTSGVAFETVELADGTELEYALVIPEGFEPDGSFPVLVALPPGGQDRDVTEGTVESIYAAQALERGWVVASPVAPGGELFFQGSERYLPELLDRLEAGLVPEDGRFYLAGVSNGGRSAFRIATLEPDRFAGMVVFPGFPDGADDVGALVDIPLRLWVGGDDTSWVGPSEEVAATLAGLGADVELTVVPGEGHIISTLRDGVDLFDALDAMRAG